MSLITLQLYSVHEYPIATLMIKTEVAKLKVLIDKPPKSPVHVFTLSYLACSCLAADSGVSVSRLYQLLWPYISIS